MAQCHLAGSSGCGPIEPVRSKALPTARVRSSSLSIVVTREDAMLYRTLPHLCDCRRRFLKNIVG